METVMLITFIIGLIGLFLSLFTYGTEYEWIIPVGMWVILIIDGILALLDMIFGIF